MPKFGFGWQLPGSGMCAHRSLVHALFLLGITITEKQAIKNIGVPRWKAMSQGTSEHELIRGIKKSGCTPHVVKCNSIRQARKKIDNFIASGMPVIISTDEEEHWAVIAGKRRRNSYYWIDSFDKELIGHWKWKHLADWMEYDDDNYYIIGVEAKDMSGSIVKKFSSIYPGLKKELKHSAWYKILKAKTSLDGLWKMGRSHFFRGFLRWATKTGKETHRLFKKELYYGKILSRS
jgi:hypothetical protein